MKYLYFLLLFLLPITVSATPPYGYAYPQAQVIKRHTVEFDADQYLGLNGYYGVQDKLKLEQLQENKTDKQTIKELIESVKSLTETVNKLSGGTKPQAEQEVEKPQVNTLDKQVFDIFRAKCAGCHSESLGKGGLKLITRDNNLFDLPSGARWNVYSRTAASPAVLKELGLDPMPQGGQPLTENEVKALYVWAVKKSQEEKNSK